MLSQALHERKPFDQDFPFKMFVSNLGKFPPHWHEEMEIIYVVEGNIDIGLNHEIHTLNTRDILMIGPGEVHHFLDGQETRKILVVQFGMALLDQSFSIFGDRRFVTPLIDCNNAEQSLHAVHKKLEAQILQILDEYQSRKEGYRLTMKARLFDMMVVLLREVAWESYSVTEKNRRLIRLERLQNVFQYVEEHYSQELSLEKAANVANFSVFHFTRFFKESTGMTFGDYVSSYRIGKAEVLLKNTEESVTEIAFKLGFNSIKTFNRVFKELKRCSPSVYRKSNI